MESAAAEASADEPARGLGWDWEGLFSAWIEIGGDPEAFGRQTPRRLKLIFDAYRKRAAREHDERAWAAWHTAGLGRMRDFPPLSDLLSTAARVEQTPAQVEAGVFAWLGRPAQPSE